jgi:hypothetical protein
VLLLVTIAKTLIELSMMFIAGRFLLGWMAGVQRQKNVFWKLLDAAASPALWLARRISPRLMLDRHVPLAAFCALLAAWVMVTLFKIDLCLGWGVAACH